MKKTYYFLIALLFASLAIETSAQMTHIPDNDFLQALINLGYGNGVEGNNIPTANIDTVTSLNVSWKSISDLTGIEDFVALTHLYCNGNQLSSLDVSANTALTSLGCSSNQLSSLEVSANTALTKLKCELNQLSSLDVSANTALTELSCYYNQLSSLDLSANTALTELYCYSNQLPSLEVSANTALTNLSCGSNQLSSLDVSANTALTNLSCGGNPLASLDVSANTALTNLSCGSNQLSNLDVSANTALTELYCDKNQLSSLDVSANTTLTKLYCEYNQLSSLDVSANTALTELYCYFNQLSSLDIRNGNNANVYYFKAYDNPNLKCIYVDNKTASYLSDWTKDETASFVNNESECVPFTYILDNNFLQALIDLGYGNGVEGNNIPTDNINEITNLDVSSQNISNLTGIEDFIALTELNCSNNQLSNLNLYSNTVLTELNCKNNQLLNLDVRNGNNANIILFNAENNHDLSCIFVDDKTASYLLSWIKDETAYFVNNEDECSTLTYIPDDNFLQALINLGYGVIGNYIATASIDTITSLSVPYRSINDLTGIEDFVALTYLYCKYNQLLSLDVSANTDLTYLNCSSNQLSSLDVRNGNNANVYYFDAYNNPDLKCIYVNNKTASYLSSWYKDETASFVNNEDECDALSVSDFTNQAIAIYPNPTNGILNFDFSEENIQMIKISDITGKIVLEKNNLKQTEVIDISHFTNGLYIVTLQTEKGIRSLKVVKK